MWTEKSHAIDQFIKGDDDVVHSKETLLFMGQREVMPVYKLPIELLSFNVDNGRFNAEKRLKEQELGFELDNRNPDHEEHFINLLLPDSPKSERLIEDIIRHGQIKPGVITYDGFLVDANRRLACMKLLNKRSPNSKYQYLLVHRLSATVPAKEIYKLEVQFQIKDDLKEKYNPINDLLKIKEGLDMMSERELAETLDWKEKTIRDYRDRLDLVDGFLEYIQELGNYKLLLDLHEHFVEFQKELSAMKNAGMSGLKLDEALDAFYCILKINVHPDNGFTKTITQRDHIRYIREAFVNDKIHNVLTRNMFNNPNATSEDIYNDVTAAAELARIQRSNVKPVEQLKRAINLLGQIPDDSEALFDDDFTESFEELEALVSQIRQQLGV